jgi:hypothetical protein
MCVGAYQSSGASLRSHPPKKDGPLAPSYMWGSVARLHRGEERNQECEAITVHGIVVERYTQKARRGDASATGQH